MHCRALACAVDIRRAVANPLSCAKDAREYSYDPTIAEVVRRSPTPSGSVPERAKRITRADDRAVGNRVWQHARAEALALTEVGRQVEVGHGLAVAARWEIQ